jgi:hypothetical protein
MPYPSISINVYIEKIPSLDHDVTNKHYPINVCDSDQTGPPKHILPPVQWVAGLFPGDQVTGAWRWPPTAFFIDDVHGYGYTAAFPPCLRGICVTFHLLITVTSFLQNSCMLKKILYSFHVFRVRYYYTNLYSVVISLYLTALRRQSNWTFLGGSLKADGNALHSDLAENSYSHASQFLLILFALWGLIPSIRSTALGSTSRAVKTKNYACIVTKTITKSQGGMKRPRYNRKKEG